jgi:biopolymer transport protein ExbD
MALQLRKTNESPSLAECLVSIGFPYYSHAPRTWSPFDRLKKKARRNAKYYCRVDSTPLAGVFTVLLFIFMCAAPPHHWSSSVDLPIAANATWAPGERREDASMVYVARDGKLHFNRVQISRAKLADRIRDAVRGGSEKRVYLAVDPRSRYGDTVAVLDAIRQSGVWQVTFLVEASRR